MRPARRSDSPAIKTEGEALVLRVCINFFGGQLKIENPRTGKQYECTRPPEKCPFRHRRSNGMTKTAMLAVVVKFPVQPRGYFEKAIIVVNNNNDNNNNHNNDNDSDSIIENNSQSNNYNNHNYARNNKNKSYHHIMIIIVTVITIGIEQNYHYNN